MSRDVGGRCRLAVGSRYTSLISSDADTIDWEPTGEGRLRAASYLTILSTELEPEELARLVGLQPDRSWKEGELRLLATGRPRGKRHPFNGVDYLSDLDKKRTPRDHFASLVERLRPYADRIAAVADLPSTHCTRIWIVEHTERDNIASILEPEEIAVVRTMHAQIAFSAYFY